MYWQKRFNRPDPDLELKNAMLAIRREHKDFGYRRLHAMLQKKSFVVNKKRVQRLMQFLCLQVNSFTRKSRKYSSYRGKVGKIAPNRIRRRFNTPILHQKITTDTTEFKYYVPDKSGKLMIKKLYLDPFMDMFNGEIISYSISSKPSAGNIMTALKNAIKVTSDWENFFALLKQEIYYGYVYNSFDELKNAIEEYIKYYNEKRIKKKLNWMSPVEYRLNHLAA